MIPWPGIISLCWSHLRWISIVSTWSCCQIQSEYISLDSEGHNQHDSELQWQVAGQKCLGASMASCRLRNSFNPACGAETSWQKVVGLLERCVHLTMMITMKISSFICLNQHSESDSAGVESEIQDHLTSMNFYVCHPKVQVRLRSGLGLQYLLS